MGKEPEIEYCSNWLCETDSVKSVPYGDTTRPLCACCVSAYEMGVWHEEQKAETE